MIKFVLKYILTSVNIINTSFKIMYLNFMLSGYTMGLFGCIYLISMHLAKLLFLCVGIYDFYVDNSILCYYTTTGLYKQRALVFFLPYLYVSHFLALFYCAV